MSWWSAGLRTIGLDLATGKQRLAKPVARRGNDLGNSSMIGMLPAKAVARRVDRRLPLRPSITFALLDPPTGTLTRAWTTARRTTRTGSANPRLVSADPPVALVRAAAPARSPRDGRQVRQDRRDRRREKRAAGFAAARRHGLHQVELPPDEWPVS